VFHHPDINEQPIVENLFIKNLYPVAILNHNLNDYQTYLLSFLLNDTKHYQKYFPIAHFFE